MRTSRFGATLCNKKGLRGTVPLGLFALLSIVATWPMASAISTAIPTGDSPTATVPLLNLWTLWWNSESLQQGLVDYWNAPIFHPTRGSFAFSEPQPVMLLFAPTIWLFNSPILAFNLYTLCTLFLNGVVAWRLARQLGMRETVAVSIGVGIELLPLPLSNLEAIQLAAVWPYLWIISCLIRLYRNECTAKRLGTEFGFAFSAAFYISIHQAFLFTPVLLLSTLLIPKENWFRYLQSYVFAAAIAILLCGAIGFKLYSVAQQHNLERPIETVRLLSADWKSWLSTPREAVISFRPFDKHADFPLLPGVLRTCFAFGAIALWRPKVKREKYLVSGLVTISILLSFGGNLGGESSYAWSSATELIPQLRLVRSPYRYAYFAQAGIILLAGCFVQTMWNTLTLTASLQRLADEKTKHLSALKFALFTISLSVLALEVLPPQTNLNYPPSKDHDEPWINFLNANSRPGDSMLCLPVAENGTEQSMQIETVWMAYQMQHRLPILNGYSGFTPASWKQLRNSLRMGAVDRKLLSKLASTPVRFIVLRRRGLHGGNSQLSRTLNMATRLKRVFEDPYYAIYEFEPQMDLDTRCCHFLYEP